VQHKPGKKLKTRAKTNGNKKQKTAAQENSTSKSKSDFRIKMENKIGFKSQYKNHISHFPLRTPPKRMIFL
jgi:hypothetical protein